jgi:histone acetyltransferase (RNA polymerase elongator complex component)
VVFPELEGCALVRELHVYGQLATVDAVRNARGAGSVVDLDTSGGSSSSGVAARKELSKSQHVGLGTRLMRHAEAVAAAGGYAKVAVISGVGVRHYYRRLGCAAAPKKTASFRLFLLCISCFELIPLPFTICAHLHHLRKPVVF